MNTKRNLIAHYQKGNSDKVYMACVRREGSKWVVIGKWGRRSETLSSQVKLTADHEAEAVAAQQSLFYSKLNKGYVDIDSASYDGGVSRRDTDICVQLEKEDAPDVFKVWTLKSRKQKDEQKQKQEDEQKQKVEQKDDDLVALCVDMTGLEDRFDQGIEYVFERHADKAMLWVYDKFGEKREVFRERFKLVKSE